MLSSSLTKNNNPLLWTSLINITKSLNSKEDQGSPPITLQAILKKIIVLPNYWQDFKNLMIDDFNITSVGDIPAHMLT